MPPVRRIGDVGLSSGGAGSPTGVPLLGADGVRGELAIDDADELVERLRPRGVRRLPALCIVPQARREDAVRSVQLARAGAPGSVVAIWSSTLPPLAYGLLLRSLSEVADLPVAHVLAIADELQRQTVAGAVLASVAGLADPAPTMGQHLFSLWPPSAFAVQTHPSASVRRVRATGQAALSPVEESVDLRVLLAGDDGPTAELARQWASGLGAVEPTGADTQSRSRWGTARYAEIAAMPADVPSVARAVEAQLAPCRSCSQPVSRTTCPFCGAHAAESPLLEGAT